MEIKRERQTRKFTFWGKLMRESIWAVTFSTKNQNSKYTKDASSNSWWNFTTWLKKKKSKSKALATMSSSLLILVCTYMYLLNGVKNSNKKKNRERKKDEKMLLNWIFFFQSNDDCTSARCFRCDYLIIWARCCCCCCCVGWLLWFYFKWNSYHLVGSLSPSTFLMLFFLSFFLSVSILKQSNRKNQTKTKRNKIKQTKNWTFYLKQKVSVQILIQLVHWTFVFSVGYMLSAIRKMNKQKEIATLSDSVIYKLVAD